MPHGASPAQRLSCAVNRPADRLRSAREVEGPHEDDRAGAPGGWADVTGWYSLAGPLVGALPPETAHRLAIRALGWGLVRPPRVAEFPALRTRVWGIDFANPIGVAAGFDKDAEAADALLALGFGHVEVGGVTPRPQAGNPRPRVFRLPRDGAVINRLGFNSRGLDAMAARLARRRARAAVVGVNLGLNKDCADAAADYLRGIGALRALADYLVINVSSPNTPGLRALQGRAHLAKLLETILEGAGARGARPPLLLKIAPDLTEEDKRDIAEVALAAGIDGLIATNTTVERPAGLADPRRAEAGGLSGRPLFAPSTRVLGEMYRLTGGKLPLVGVGGVASGADAYAKIRAGASLVQLYTALVYHGPGLAGRIKAELADLLAADGVASVADAVGADA